MVYVLNREGKPLMPTTRYGRVRRLLEKRLAVVVGYRPFTIQLTYNTPNGVHSVEYAGRHCFVNGRRQSGYFSLSDVSGKVLAGSVSYRHLTLINHNNFNILENAELRLPTKGG